MTNIISTIVMDIMTENICVLIFIQIFHSPTTQEIIQFPGKRVNSDIF